MIARALMSLLFPSICSACHGALANGERYICIDCRLNLPRTNYHKFPDNPVSRLFYGRISVDAATSLFYFKKQSKVQNLVHGLKYKSQKELSVQLGHMLGSDLAASPAFQEIDLVMPVPLHKKKLKARGYNQSEGFATGIAETTNSVSLPQGLMRTSNTSSQTRKSRIERWNNVKDVFTVAEPDVMYKKNVLIVDDVITTGATLEACCNAALEAGAGSVRIATIAYAEI